jgi:hypothetical protein
VHKRERFAVVVVGAAGALVLALGLILVVYVRRHTGPNALGATRSEEGCRVSVSRADLETSLDLGTRFLLAHQKEAGNFDYEYDWRTKSLSNDDNQVRQAGAVWGLALLEGAPSRGAVSKDLRRAVEKGLAFFDDGARETPGKGRFPVYPSREEASGSLGTAALVTLAIIDHVRALPPSDVAERSKWTARANQYVAFLLESKDAVGTWHGKYHADGGAGFGAHSPYADGEALLALTKALKYLGRDDLAPVVAEAARSGHAINVERALDANPDSDTTKGYYQWASMAYFELATSPWASDAPYGEWLLRLADWIIDVHRVRERPRNTGYAYEGILPALAWARATGDGVRARRYECTVHEGIDALLQLQVGHPRAAALGAIDDPRAGGGVQNHRTESALRIDVTQHQMHATLLALRYLFRGDGGV